ncbi:MAG: PAN domain-containing protein [Nitrospira sp.]|nr:PAN domain-containing protein [Nitrospira sp.]
MTEGSTLPDGQRINMLDGAQKRRLRLFDPRDWFSWVSLVVVLGFISAIAHYLLYQDQTTNYFQVFKALVETPDEQTQSRIIARAVSEPMTVSAESQRQVMENVASFIRTREPGLKCEDGEDPDKKGRCVIFTQEKQWTNPDPVIRNEGGKVTLTVSPNNKRQPCPYFGARGGSVKSGNPCRLEPPKGERLYQTKYEVYYLAHRTETPEKVSMDENKDRYGYDYRDFDPAEKKPDECREECAHDRQCKAFAFRKDGGHCWLKNDIPAQQANTDVISGCKGECSN